VWAPKCRDGSDCSNQSAYVQDAYRIAEPLVTYVTTAVDGSGVGCNGWAASIGW